MEALYLLCSLVFYTLKSAILSFLLLFQVVRRRCARQAGASTARNEPRKDEDEEVSYYKGIVWHERRSPVRHSFRYAVRYALINLDHPLETPGDHFSADEARRIANTSGPVFLLTIPPSLGYEQNPLSLYYCYDLQSSNRKLKKCIAEVTNTPWGERVSFLFNPRSDLVAKPLHVSPFMDMHGNWSIKVNDPGDNLLVAISIQHPKLGHYFTATLNAKKVPSSLDHALFFWLVPHKVALWIYMQALMLWWKNVEFIQHPKLHNLLYKEEAMARDRKLKCPWEIQVDKNENLHFEGSDSDFVAEKTNEGSRFRWRDAKWPWS